MRGMGVWKWFAKFRRHGHFGLSRRVIPCGLKAQKNKAQGLQPCKRETKQQCATFQIAFPVLPAVKGL